MSGGDGSPDLETPTLRMPGTLTVCAYTHFTPISYGVGEGYEADLVRAIARHWGVTTTFLPVDQFDGI